MSIEFNVSDSNLQVKCELEQWHIIIFNLAFYVPIK